MPATSSVTEQIKTLAKRRARVCVLTTRSIVACWVTLPGSSLNSLSLSLRSPLASYLAKLSREICSYFFPTRRAHEFLFCQLAVVVQVMNAKLIVNANLLIRIAIEKFFQRYFFVLVRVISK